jgi:hypothetical protein
MNNLWIDFHTNKGLIFTLYIQKLYCPRRNSSDSFRYETMFMLHPTPFKCIIGLCKLNKQLSNGYVSMA